MARAGAHFAKPPPDRPVAPQQALSIRGPDEIGKRRPLNVVGRSRGFFEIPFEHFVTELIGEREALDQPVANLLIRRLALVAGEALAKAPHRAAERGGVELHRRSASKKKPQSL